jgi:hypothetical protein
VGKGSREGAQEGWGKGKKGLGDRKIGRERGRKGERLQNKGTADLDVGDEPGSDASFLCGAGPTQHCSTCTIYKYNFSP